MVSASSPSELAEQNLDAGDIAYPEGQTLTLDSGSNSVSAGEAVTFDGSGDIQSAAAGAEHIGHVLPTSDEDADNMVEVVIDRLPVVYEVTDGPSKGDEIESDGSGAWQTAATPADWMPVVVGDVDTDNDLYLALART